MKKLFLLLSLVMLASCTSESLYEKADPTEEIKIGEMSQKQMLHKEKRQWMFNPDEFIHSLRYNQNPNAHVIEFPELLKRYRISDRNVFSF